MSPEKRGKLLFKLADLLERDADIFAHIETMDNGKVNLQFFFLFIPIIIIIIIIIILSFFWLSY